ncbi:MAG: FAD-dependent oxidoreductase [Deltaproteobacteria bacterium]|nr:FAD-dependent oxidoreductase [Deltaproteobacteria bacterium]
MSRGRSLGGIARIAHVARLAEQRRLDSRAASGDFAERLEARRLSRRSFLGGLGATAVAGLGVAAFGGRVRAALQVGTRISIIGGGLAGLACADTLARNGVVADVYEAHPERLGGRCLSDRLTFAPQVAEVGGELIDNLHKTMIGYARELGLPLEDLEKAPGAPTFFFGGQHYSEAEVVDEYRVLVERMRPDLQSLSGAPTYYAHTPADAILDHTDLATYLDTRAPDLPLIRKVLGAAYMAEYGLELHEQSALNMLLFLHLDRASHFREFGVFSDERYHVKGGNDAIVKGLADRLPGRVHKGARMNGLSRDASGYHLSFTDASFNHTADAVVCTIPFSVLRGIALDDTSLGISRDKRRAIDELGYGANAKTMIGFDRRRWTELGRDGLVYSDLEDVQNVWESNYSVGAPRGILTDYSSGARAVALQRSPSSPLPPAEPTFGCGGCHAGSPYASQLNATGAAWVDAQAEAFLADLDRVWPGVQAAASRGADDQLVVRRGHWLPQPLSKGSYTCYRPGQFTGIAGLEGEPAGGLKFAGEHADSFYEWQGFMEGACNSGIAAAQSLIDDIKAGRLPR